MLKQSNIVTSHYSSIRQTKQDSPSINQVGPGPNRLLLEPYRLEDIDLSLYLSLKRLNNIFGKNYALIKLLQEHRPYRF